MLSRSHRWVLKALLPMVLSGCAVSQSLTDRLPKMGRDRYSEQLLAARMAEQSGELLRARKSYEELLKRHPDKVDLHHRLGVLCQKSGDEQAAISYLSRAHELSPTNVEVLCDLGYSQYLQGKTQEAVEVYRRAQQINPSHPRTQTNLGIALIDIGEISTAMTTLRQSMSESDAASTVGFALVQKGDLLQAREYFTRAIDSDPTSQKAAEALVQLGELLAAEHNVAQGLPAAQNPAGNIGTATQSEAPSGAPASRPETVNFESLYSQKIEQPVKSGTQTIPAAAAAVENTVPLSASGHAVVDSFRASADENAGVALPPIESVQRREQTTVAHSNNSSKVQLSHTSLRADESAASARLSADVSDGLEDLGEFVESSPASSPVQGIRSLDERRRSGGLIEPMLGSNARARRSEAATEAATEAEAEAERSLPPVTESVEHGPRRLAASKRRGGAENATAVQEPEVEEAAQTADAVKTPVTNLPTVAPQAVPAIAQAGAAVPGTQMVLVRDASGQFFQMPLVMPAMPAPAAAQFNPQPVPVFTQMPQMPLSPMGQQVPPGSYAQPVQQIAYRPAGELAPGYMQPGPAPALPQIYANGQPINAAGFQAPTAPQYTAPPQYTAVPQNLQGPQYPMDAQYQPVATPPQLQPYGSAPQYPPGPQYSPGKQYAPGPQPAMPPQYPASNFAQSTTALDGMQPVTGMQQQEQQQNSNRALSSGPAESGLPAMSPAARVAHVTSLSPRGASAPAIPISQPSAATQHVVTPAAAAGTTPQSSSALPVVSTGAQMPGSTASVGGLPLAFLRSFYAQMSLEQQALFWRDLRQMRGGSAAEKAVYRELAESSVGLAQIEAAITMLAVFEEQALADRLLSKAAESADPTIQQAARTALSMLPVQTLTRR